MKGLEPLIACSQSRCPSRWATSRTLQKGLVLLHSFMFAAPDALPEWGSQSKNRQRIPMPPFNGRHRSLYQKQMVEVTVAFAPGNTLKSNPPRVKDGHGIVLKDSFTRAVEVAVTCAPERVNSIKVLPE